MNMLMKKIVLSLMLLASTLSVFANPGQPRAEHEAVRAVRQEQETILKRRETFNIRNLIDLPKKA